jgi:DNA primase
VVEGYIDAIACVGAGFEATLAPLGTALTEDQLRLLWQMAEEPVLCFDGDEPGLRAAFRAAELALPLVEPNRSLRFALLPEGRDPDDLIRAEGRESFARLLASAQPLVDMLWLSVAHGVDLSTPERRAGIEQALRTAAARIRNTDIRRHYDQALRERLARFFGGAPPAAAASPRRQRRAVAGRRYPEPEPSAPSPSLLAHRLVRSRPPGGTPSLPDSVLLGVLIIHPEIAAERLEALAEMRFHPAPLAALAAALQTIIAEHPQVGAAELRAALAHGGHDASVSTVLDRLLRAGLGALRDAGRDRAAATWDEAAYLRLRAGTLSIERQAAATALGRDPSDADLVRLRDIQEQDQRGLRDPGRGTEAATIVHPLKPH